MNGGIPMKEIFKNILTATTLAIVSLTGLNASAAGERYVLVSHAPDSDSWWNTIKNGIALAGDQMDVKVEYRNPPTGDLADMANYRTSRSLKSKRHHHHASRL
jgi:simple sugar transport system substrate-binding protein